MKKICSLLICLSLILLLSSCDVITGILCDHRDADDDGRCDTCGSDYSDGDEKQPCQHKDANDDCFCDTCHEPFSDEEEISCDHSYGEWMKLDTNDGTLCDTWLMFRACTVCGHTESKPGSYDSHSFTELVTPPSCTEQGYTSKICDDCGLTEILSYTDPTGHVYKTVYSYDLSHHWHSCESCDSIDAYEKHSADYSGFCTVCDAPVTPSDGLEYKISKDSDYASVVSYSGANTRVIISDTYLGLPVKSISQEAFAGNTSITQIIMPDSITAIEPLAFYSCQSLETVIMGNNVVTIGDYAFFSCIRLKSIILPSSVETIGEEAFSACISLANINIPDSVTAIGKYAFAFCLALAEVRINECAALVDEGAFLGCSEELYTTEGCGVYVGDGENPYAIFLGTTDATITEFELNEKTVIIAYAAFAECVNLTKLVIPDGVTAIGSKAFWYCFTLSDIELPNALVAIGSYAFKSCYAVSTVTLGRNLAYIGDEALNSYGIDTINYRGSEEEWKEVTKKSSWTSSSTTIIFDYTGE